MSVVNGSDLYMWIGGNLIAYSRSYTITIDMETRPGTNKGSGIWRRPLPGMLSMSGTTEGLYVFQNNWSVIANKIIERSPVRLQFGPKNLSGTVDEDVEYISGDFLITSIELNATDAENATFTAAFTYYDNFGAASSVTLPTVTTGRQAYITNTTVTAYGEVTSDGGALVVNRGICYNTSGIPTISNSTSPGGSGVGPFSCGIINLTPGTTYYVRAYATNEAGTTYGAQQSFATENTLGYTAVPDVYFVKTDGNNALDGTTNATAWATWQYAFSQLSAGDTLYIHGGTYSPTETVFSGYDVGAYAWARDGEAGNLITVQNYPGHTPIMNATNVDGAYTSIGVYLHSCDYWFIKGLTIQNCPGFGMSLQACTNITVELCESRYNVGSGFRVFNESDDVLFLNCDAHHNVNPGTPQSPDGFEASNISYRAGHLRKVTYIGCRSWDNSDDGFDHWNMDGELVYDKCWAWHNGYNIYDEDHNGDGFKLGQTSLDMSALFARTVTNCVAWDNSLYGFTQNNGNTKYIFYNNTSALNYGGGFNLWWYDYGDIIMNNISCMNVQEEWNGTYVNRTIATNSYDHKLPLGPVASAADFVNVSLIGTGADGARQADGSLPVITFLHLATGSDLIAAGTAIAGLTTDGDGVDWEDPPSIGAFEYV